MEKGGYVKNANLLFTILIPLSKIVLGVREGVFNVYILRFVLKTPEGYTVEYDQPSH